jgi:hypothetical protein
MALGISGALKPENHHHFIKHPTASSRCDRIVVCSRCESLPFQFLFREFLRALNQRSGVERKLESYDSPYDTWLLCSIGSNKQVGAKYRVKLVSRHTLLNDGSDVPTQLFNSCSCSYLLETCDAKNYTMGWLLSISDRRSSKLDAECPEELQNGG